MAAGALCVLGKDPTTELHAQPPTTSVLFSLPSISSSVQVRSNITCTFFKVATWLIFFRRTGNLEVQRILKILSQ